MSKHTKYKDYNASTGARDYFGMVFDSMCKSKAYQNLSLSARQFYIICRVQARSKEGRQCLFNHGKEENKAYTEYDFVFPKKHMEAYGYDRSNACRYLKELEAAGFIKVKERNKHRKKVNVYSFSSEWKN